MTALIEETQNISLNELRRVVRKMAKGLPGAIQLTIALPLDEESDLVFPKVDSVVDNFLHFVKVWWLVFGGLFLFLLFIAFLLSALLHDLLRRHIIHFVLLWAGRVTFPVRKLLQEIQRLVDSIATHILMSAYLEFSQIS